MLAAWAPVQITGTQKPTEEETNLFLLQFDSSTGHDQTSEPVNHSVWYY